MLFLIVLAVATAASAVVLRRSSRRDQARAGLGLAMAFAGAGHLFMPEPFIQHLPSWVPLRTELIYATGLVEIGLGAALMGPARWRPLVSLALAGYLIAVFPSNIYVAVEGVNVDGQPGGIYPWLRLPLQPLFVALAVWSGRALEAAPTLKSFIDRYRSRPASRVAVQSP